MKHGCTGLFCWFSALGGLLSGCANDTALPDGHEGGIETATMGTTTAPDDGPTAGSDAESTGRDSGPAGNDDSTSSGGGADEDSTGLVESCRNAILDQDETDIDCGGSICEPCALGETCAAPVDCVSEACSAGVCIAPACLTDADCTVMDGECAVGVCGADYQCGAEPANEDSECVGDDLCQIENTCIAGSCTGGVPLDCSALDGQCTQGTCDPRLGCVATPANERAACDDDDLCTTNTACAAGVCDAGVATDCSAFADACNEAVCDPESGCAAQPFNEGGACDDGDVCTLEGECVLGGCESSLAGLFEDFADNDAGWTLDTNWAIGPAVDGCGDPALDHTNTDDNGIAGVVIGGCAPPEPVDASLLHCLTSPAVDTTAWGSASLGFWRELWSDYTPYMQSRIDVFDGSDWQNIFLTLGSPGVDDQDWTHFEYDVSAYLATDMRVRWCYSIGSTGVFDRGSWNLDDVALTPATCEP